MNQTDESTTQSADGEFAHWVDPNSGKEFVLVPVEHFEKLRAIIDGATRRAGWDDQALDVYEQYRKAK